MNEEIRDFLDCGSGSLVGTARFLVMRLVSAVLTPAATFFCGFPVAGLWTILGLF